MMVRSVRSLTLSSLAVAGTVLLSAGGGIARAEIGDVPKGMAASDLVEKLGSPVDPTLHFVDHEGKQVALGDYFQDGRPVLLTLNYYSCQTLCSTQLNGLLSGLKELELSPIDDFRIVTVSIDPAEDASLAAGKRSSYLQELGMGPEVEWHFLTGEQSQIRALADSVGYSYAYDEKSGQWAHPAVLTFVAPEGFVARYLYGIEYPARDLKFALMEAAAGRVGSPVDKLILSCFRYDDSTGEYTPAAMGVMRLGGVFTLIAMGGLGAVMWTRSRRRDRSRSPRA